MAGRTMPSPVLITPATYQRVAADRLELMMQMEADRMTGLQLSPDDIVVERNVVIEERNQRTESAPGALV